MRKNARCWKTWDWKKIQHKTKETRRGTPHKKCKGEKARRMKIRCRNRFLLMVCGRLHLHSKLQPGIKSISGCVHFVCSGLMATSLLMHVDCQDFLSKTFCQFLLTSLQISSCIKIFTDLMQLDEANRLDSAW